MLWPHQTIVRRDLFALPVAPATSSGYRLRQSPELLRPGHQPICFAVRVFGDAIPPQINLLRPYLNKEHATAEQPSIVVTSGTRQHDLGLGRGQNGLEVAPVGRGDRQGGEFARRNDMVGE